MTRTLRMLVPLALLSGCAALRPELPLDQRSDLVILAEHEPRRDVQQWRIQRTYAGLGPTNHLGVPVFSADFVAFEHGPDHPEIPGLTGLILRFHSQAPEWIFLHEREVVLVLDGERTLLLGAGDHEAGELVQRSERGNPSAPVVTEMLVIPVRRHDAERIAQAESVQVQVGARHRFQLHPATLEVLGRLLEILPESVR